MHDLSVQTQFISWDKGVAERDKKLAQEIARAGMFLSLDHFILYTYVCSLLLRLCISAVQLQVDAAVKELEPARVDLRPTQSVEVTGHLFDKAVLNRLLDVIVDRSDLLWGGYCSTFVECSRCFSLFFVFV